MIHTTVAFGAVTIPEFISAKHAMLYGCNIIIHSGLSPSCGKPGFKRINQ